MTEQDPPDEWPDQATEVDPSLAETAPHRSIEWLGGREAGFTEGTNRVIGSVVTELLAVGWTGTEIAALTARLRAAANSRR